MLTNPSAQSETNLNFDSRWRTSPALASVAVVLAAVVFFGLIRYRLREMPLERDEGEYAYAGQLLLQGIPPYKLAYNMKLPGIYAAYAGIFAVFGETAAGIHLGLLVVNAATTILLYFLTARLFGRLAGVVAACCYALLSTSSSVMGFEAHATNFVVLPALLGILLLLSALETGPWWAFLGSGALCGIAFLMKQHGAFFVLFCFLYLVTGRKERRAMRRVARDVVLFGAGVILPYVCACWLLHRAGVFPEFWFWTVSYAAEYSKIGFHRAVRAFLENFRTVTKPAIAVWILAAIGITAPFWNARARKHVRFLVGLFACSFLALCPGAYFRPHYFVLLLPVAAILVGVAVVSATEMIEVKTSCGSFYRAVPVLILAACFAYAVFRQRHEYFFMRPEEVFQQTYRENPFQAAIKVADYVKQNSSPTATIAVAGSEPEIYFYANRHSATGYLYMYGLIVHHKYTAQMRQQMLRELNANHPEYVVYVDEWSSWGDRNGGAQTAAFLSALQAFMDSLYERVGVAEIGGTTNYVWGDAAKSYLPRSPSAIYVLKRKQPRAAAQLLVP
jgi:hypothetical protein